MSADRITLLKEMIQEVESAIRQLISKQVKSYKLGERWFTYFDLAELIQWRNQLIRELNQLQSGTYFPVYLKPFIDEES
ncbi:MAG: hypothetical protein QXV44_02440 [Candidatus Anstonellaceae archaeon]